MKKLIISKDESINLKGIFALLVLIHHIIQFSPTISGYYKISFGFLFVDMFFFLSGYGLMARQEKKLDISFFKRILKLYISFILATIFYILIRALYGVSYDIVYILKSLYANTIIVNFSWFIFELIILYMFYYVSFKNYKKYYSILKLFFLCVCFAFLCVLLKSDTWWFMSILSFPLGVFTYNEFKTKIIMYLNLLFYPIFLSFIVSSLIVFPYAKIIEYLSILGLSLTFPIFFVNIYKLYPIKIGKIREYSTEIFLIQGLPIKYFSETICLGNDFLFVICVFFTTILLAIIFKLFLNLIVKKILK